MSSILLSSCLRCSFSACCFALLQIQEMLNLSYYLKYGNRLKVEETFSRLKPYKIFMLSTKIIETNE
ncbi:hypothetical protein [Candidatus Tisiphia endosymbiont of Ditula angustiorana]|uniref:hypothetical protein n=1 Tax=Candidatus Tisiphia endosymbiont of Ditula angustiorana TaxID=3066272 RepID=UPI00312CAA03